MKRFLVGVLTGIMFISSLSVSVNAEFSDIQGHWAQSYILSMVNDGSINGYEDGTFKPDRNISKSEFLAIAMRAAIPDFESSAALTKNISSGYSSGYITPEGEMVVESGYFDHLTDTGLWWETYYNCAVILGVIGETDFPKDRMENDITREEMVYIMLECLRKKEGHLERANVKGTADMIADYYSIDERFRDNFATAYTLGLIQGKEGNLFDPKANATRAEAATVLYRIRNPHARQMPDFKVFEEFTGSAPNLDQPITIYEGQERRNRLARVGDTVVKADGTQVVLQLGPNGILGEGQGVAPDLGFYYFVPYDNTSRVADGKMFTGGATERWTNSIGSYVVGDFYHVHPLTGEGHWDNEWSVIFNASYDYMLENGIEGKYDGEISEDKQLVWNSLIKDWLPVYNGRNLK